MGGQTVKGQPARKTEQEMQGRERGKPENKGFKEEVGVRPAPSSGVAGQDGDQVLTMRLAPRRSLGLDQTLLGGEVGARA